MTKPDNYKRPSLIIELTEQHKNTWVNKPEWFWWLSLVEEVIELAGSLLGIHKHPPELELAQIATISTNWRNHRIGTVATYSQLVEMCQEVAKEPYPDSDPASLLETLRGRARKVLGLLDE